MEAEKKITAFILGQTFDAALNYPENPGKSYGNRQIPAELQKRNILKQVSRSAFSQYPLPAKKTKKKK
jgi:hypothetical protein